MSASPGTREGLDELLARLLRTRSEVPRWSWWNRMVWLSVAVNNWTGNDTRPKVKAPFHTARAMAALTSSRLLHGTAPDG
ncbi:hypothetical protein [Streptomyces sp. SD15]